MSLILLIGAITTDIIMNGTMLCILLVIIIDIINQSLSSYLGDRAATQNPQSH